MKKNIFSVLFILLFIAGCASVQKLPEGTKFSIESFKVNLTQKYEVEGYPDQAEFSKIMEKEFMSSLKEKGLQADGSGKNTMNVSIVLDYKRQFAGEGISVSSKSVIAPELGYTIVVSQNGVETNRIAKSDLTISRGFLGNLKSVATMGLANDKENELKDMQTVASVLTDELKALVK